MEFHKKYRPSKLSEVVGQDSAVSQLTGFLNKKQTPHAILFTGPSGCGKTTLARIMASAIECRELDISEINMADDRGIEIVRKIQDTIHFRPLSGGNRAYILDEFHSITPQAGQAFLKLFEDMPPYVYFFVCTSEPQKIPKALQTRLTKVTIGPLAGVDMGKLIDRVAEAEEIDLPPGIKGRITASANGSARTALVMLAQLHATGFDKATVEQVTLRIGEPPENLLNLARELLNRQSWDKVYDCASTIPEEELESARWMLLRYAEKCMGSKTPGVRDSACLIIEAMSRPFFDGKRPEFLAKCFRIMHQTV